MLSYHMGWTDQHGSAENTQRAIHLPAILALTTCEQISGNFRQALPVAAALELMHNFTTVHGDVQDGGNTSQTRPSIWWVWGPSQAINAGDGLHALARSAIMRLTENSLDSDVILQAIKSLDEACLSFCEGQYMDLTFQDQLLITEGDYLSMIGKKSGALPACGGSLGAICAGASETFIYEMAIFGQNLGMASQLIQDINELWGPKGNGMTPSNLIQKKKSLPLIYAFENSSIAVKRELGNIYMKRVLEPEDSSRVIEILNDSGAKDYSESRVNTLISDCLTSLRKVSIPGGDFAEFESLLEIATTQRLFNVDDTVLD